MTDVFDDLLSSALVGTDRRPTRLADVPGPLGAALAAVPTADPAGALLDAAALATVYRRAGVQPTSGLPLPSPAPPETRPEAPPVAAQRLGSLLEAAPAVAVEWLEVADSHGVRVPAWLLPQLLDRARHEPALRTPMLAVGGRRMRWLAGQNPDWRYLSRVGGAVPVDGAADDADWEFGDDGRRLDHLRALRAVDPSAAREKLAAEWESQTPAQRAAQLAAFEVGLSHADEQFLESALDDRRQEVRRAAADQLARLPDSGYAARMATRAAACLSADGRRLRLVRPGEPDPAGRRDGLRGGAGSAAATHRLEQILQAAPLSSFRAPGRPLTSLLKWADGEADRGLLLTAMALAAERESDVDAAAELLSWRHIDRYEVFDRLVPVVPDADRVGLVTDWLTRGTIRDGATDRMLDSCPRPWSVELGQATLTALGRHAGRLGYRAYRWAVLLGERLPVQLLPQAVRLATSAANDDTTPGMDRLVELATLRRQMHEEFL